MSTIHSVDHKEGIISVTQEVILTKNASFFQDLLCMPASDLARYSFHVLDENEFYDNIIIFGRVRLTLDQRKDMYNKLLSFYADQIKNISLLITPI
jgi:hypothetical protein